MEQGTIRDWDDQRGEGSLLTDTRREIHIDRRSTDGSGILVLRIGQRVKFDVADEDGRAVARGLRLVTFD